MSIATHDFKWTVRHVKKPINGATKSNKWTYFNRGHGMKLQKQNKLCWCSIWPMRGKGNLLKMNIWLAWQIKTKKERKIVTSSLEPLLAFFTFCHKGPFNNEGEGGFNNFVKLCVDHFIAENFF